MLGKEHIVFFCSGKNQFPLILNYPSSKCAQVLKGSVLDFACIYWHVKHF